MCLKIIYSQKKIEEADNGRGGSPTSEKLRNIFTTQDTRQDEEWVVDKCDTTESVSDDQMIRLAPTNS